MGSRYRVLAVIACVVLTAFLSSCVTSPQSGQAAPHKPLQPEYTFWPQDVSDLKPDPGVKYGVLSNGLHYAIMRNVQPAGAVSLKLRIASGSFQETDQQRGMAHFLEHMAFNGSKNVPEGEFVKLLQRKGLAFGAHTNAYTSTDETVYMLELPKNSPDLIDTGLMLFREVGGNLLLEQKSIDREKGVVLSEQRSKNTPEYRAFEARWNVWYEGQLQASRMPIGTRESIASASREQVAEYYYRNYRPERALLVVAGDVDTATIEKLVADKFSDWKGVGQDVPDPDLGTPKKRELTVQSRVEPNLPEEISVTWFQPSGLEADTLAARISHSRWWMATAILSRRLDRLARSQNPAFVSAAVGYSENRGVSNSFSVSIDCKSGTWKRAMAAVEQELRRAAEHGFTQAEIARELKEWKASLEDEAGSASTRPTSALANGLVSQFSSRDVFTHPTDDLAIFQNYAPTLTPKSVQDGLREIMVGSGPVIFVSSGQAIQGGDKAIASAYEESRQTPVTAAADIAAKDFPYTNFGPAGVVSSHSKIEDFGVSLYQFANGVRVNFKQTNFEKDTVNIAVRFGGGFLSLPPDKPGMYWLLPFSFTEGGLKKLTTEELEAALAGRIISTELSLDDDAFEFGGRTNQRDFLLQLQLLAAYATDPAYRSLGLERQQTSAESDIKQFSSSPGRVLSRETSALLRSGDKRWLFPTLQQLQSINMKDVETAIGPALAGAPIEISIVGDISEQEVEKAVAQTFGAFAKRSTTLTERPGARAVHFPGAGRHLQFTHEGAADQAVAYAAWSAPDFYSSPRRARTLSLLREMLKVRLTDEFREAQGATYSPSASSTYSTTFKGFGYVAASAETKPELVEGFYKTLDRVIAELQSGSFSDDVVERARTPVIKSIEKARLANGYWEGAISDIQTEPRGLDALRSQLSDLPGITRADLVQAARQYLGSAHRIEVRVLPKKPQVMFLPTDHSLARRLQKLVQPQRVSAHKRAA
ncbi:MAG: insulinase family protein [Micropepsaceae bacterium]